MTEDQPEYVRLQISLENKIPKIIE